MASSNGNGNGTALMHAGGQGTSRTPKGQEVVRRRHQDWYENNVTWRWLLDSFEGGTRYRDATYGPDRRGLPTRNLFRHRREYPDAQEYPNSTGWPGLGSGGFLGQDAIPKNYTGFGPYPGSLGAGPASTAQDDDYELRRARTPVPGFVTEAIEVHLSKVYDQEIARDGPPEIVEWWSNVDGKGTPIDDWMREVVAPLLVALGCLDVCLDHPVAPGGVVVTTRADERRLGLDACVASYSLPQNMVWWRADSAGRYEECLIREYADPSARMDLDSQGRPIDTEDTTKKESRKWQQDYVRWRHWTTLGWTLYNNDGSRIVDEGSHPFGVVPIVRLIDKIKHRSPFVGKSRYESTAELQREYYNRDSELILSDTLQAHPFLSGPDDYCKADNTISVGPGYILPMKKNTDTGSYQGWTYVSPPKDPAESLRANLRALVDRNDRVNHLIKPAGTVGTAATTVSQSGLSKEMDSVSGNRTLNSLAKSLAKAERFLAEYAWMVLHNQVPDPSVRASIKITYPARFELHSAQELAGNMGNIQQTAQASGELPETEATLLHSQIRLALVGLGDDQYKRMEDEVRQMIARKTRMRAMLAESAGLGVSSHAEALEGEAGPDGRDPTGQSGGTAISGIVPSVLG